MMIATAVLALLVINVVTFLRFGIDKRRAIAGTRRVPEADLLGLAMIGGTPAAYAARRYFRHKTRKQPFSTLLAAIAMVQAGLLGGLAIALFQSGTQV